MAPSLSYWLFRLAAVLVPRLPQAVLPALTEVLGTMAFMVGAKARRTARDNIAPVVGRARSLRVARQMFVHNVQYYLSLFTPRPKGFRLQDHQLEGWEHFHQALEGGRGCILVSPHLGDINFYAELFVADGLPVNVVVENLQPKPLCDLVVNLRERRGVHVIVAGSRAPRQIYRALERNEIVAFVSDRVIDAEAFPAEMFGRKIMLPSLAFNVAARRHIPVVFGTAVRLPGDRIVADVRRPFVPTEDVQEHVRAMAAAFEQFIGRFPGHWLAFQPIWRTA